MVGKFPSGSRWRTSESSSARVYVLLVACFALGASYDSIRGHLLSLPCGREARGSESKSAICGPASPSQNDEPLNYFAADPEEAVMRVHLQGACSAPINFSDPASYLHIVWPPTSPVLVPAMHNEINEVFPRWLLRWPVFLYQRKSRDLPRYCPNHGFEGGVYLQFILDFYDNLPNTTVFLQGMPQIHNEFWEEWLSCLRPTANFTPMTRNDDLHFLRRTPLHWGAAKAPYVANCWRNLARAFHLNFATNEEWPSAAVYAGQMYAVSRSILRQRSRLEYKRAHGIITARGDACHVADMDWDESGELIFPQNTSRALPDGVYEKTTQGEGMEHLFHWVVGGQEVEMPRATQETLCASFKSQTECHAQSPCE